MFGLYQCLILHLPLDWNQVNLKSLQALAQYTLHLTIDHTQKSTNEG